MDAERWQRLSPLLDSLLELANDERAHRLHRLRLDDPALAAELQRLLDFDAQDPGFLAQPLADRRQGVGAGSRLGPYQLLELLGEGGMGQVWLAERADGLYQRRLALKLLRPGYADPNLRLRFSREREILARLQHPNIARLLDAGVADGDRPYLVLEYVDGVPITDYCQAHQLPLRERLQLFLQVCAAVSHAHANLIVHRDLKPSNMLVGEGPEVRLLDFGIAKLLDLDEGDQAHPRTEVRAFTLHYAAPEQIRGEPVSTLTDVYSLGVVLYELLSGDKPYRLRRQSDGHWEQAILDVVPPRASQAVQRLMENGQLEPATARRLARRLRGDLDTILMRALAKVPGERYSSVETLAADIRRYLRGLPIQARPPRLGYRLHKYLLRHRWAVGLGGLAAVGMLAALGTAMWKAREASHEAARAQALQGFVVGLFDHAGGAGHANGQALRELLSAGARRGQAELRDQPRAHAELLGVLARLYVGIGDYPQALVQAQAQQQRLADDPDAPQALRVEAAAQHGRILRLLSRSRECIQRTQPLLEAAGALQSTAPRVAADFYMQYGRCQRTLGQPQLARHWYNRALALRQDTLRDDSGVVETLLDLAALDSDAADTQAAISRFLQAQAQLRRRLGERHPLAVEVQRSLGVLYLDRGQAEEAEAVLVPALALSSELHGASHPLSLAVRRQLGLAWLRQGRLQQAAGTLEAQHVLTRALLGSSHREAGLSLDALGRLALEQGDTGTAIARFEEAIGIWRQPDGHHLLDYGLHDLGMALQADGQWLRAEQTLREAWRLRVRRLGRSHPAVGDLERSLGEVLQAQGRPREAAPWLQRAVALTGAGYGADDPRSVAARLALAQSSADPRQPLAALLRQLPEQPRLRALRWRTEAGIASVRCARGEKVAGSARQLARLATQAQALRPEGGSINRELARLAAQCPVQG
jgi:serine/threonine protein kinase/tetratricopeptide (TPR) repeat protein